MKRFYTLVMLVLFSLASFAQQTVTVTANNEDISEGLDLRIVAKLFAEAQNMEDFELMLNQPDSMFNNLDINGDGNVDYLRVIEVGEGDTRLIVLQAILAPDIYQDVASIYVEKDLKNNVSVQIIGDEYVYGKNYIIEPVYIYRPRIYTWLWSSIWCRWYSPWYWDCYPHWWYYHHCWYHDRYWHHCYRFHHHHHHCSFRHGHQPHPHYYDTHKPVAHHEYADTHRGTSFNERNFGATNAHDLTRNGSGVSTRQPSNNNIHGDRTYNSRSVVTNRANPTVSNRPSSSTQSRTSSSQTRQPLQSMDRKPSTSTTRTSTNTQQRTSSSSTTQRQTSTQVHGQSSNSSTRTTHSSQPSSQTRSSGSVNRSSGSSHQSSGSMRSSGGSSRSGGSQSSSRSSGSSSSSRRR